MFERFTGSARRVVVLAQEESRLLNHDRIGTEHLLLALLHVEEGDTGRALHSAGATLEDARRRVEESAGRGKKEPSGHIPFTQRAKKVLERALRASQRQGKESIGQPHLLSALLEVRDGAAFQLLVDLGVDTEALAAVAEDLGSRAEAGQAGGRAGAVRVRSARATGDLTPRSERWSAEDLAAHIGRLALELAAERTELARGLARYGRHDDECHPAQGCTCGLADLLKIAAREPDEAS